MYNKFIVFEGIEGCGKSTQLALTQQWLKELGLKVVTTKQPGGTPLGEKIRALLLTDEQIDDAAELLLYVADRAQHHAFLVEAIQNADVVLCDRYTHSTIAYQAYGRQQLMSFDRIAWLNQLATDNLKPDLTIWLDVPVAIALERVAARGKLDRIESEELNFHQRCRGGYCRLHADQHEIDGASIVKIDGNRSEDSVQQDIQFKIRGFLQQNQDLRNFNGTKNNA